jgi:hypothetical protein
MRIVVAALFLSSLILTNWLTVKCQDWRQIVPLKSTRAEVERLLGSTTGAYFARYELKEGSLFVEYSSGPCKPERKGGWILPKDVIIMVNFTPKHRTRIDTLKLDPKKFKIIVDDHVIGALYYVNDEEGTTYAVQNGKIEFIEHHPAKKDEHLYCGDPADPSRPQKQVPPQSAALAKLIRACDEASKVNSGLLLAPQ